MANRKFLQLILIQNIIIFIPDRVLKAQKKALLVDKVFEYK